MEGVLSRAERRVGSVKKTWAQINTDTNTHLDALDMTTNLISITITGSIEQVFYDSFFVV